MSVTQEVKWSDVRPRPHITQAVQFDERAYNQQAYAALGVTLHRSVGEWKLDTGVTRAPLTNYDRKVGYSPRVLVTVHDGDWIIKLASGRFAVVAADEFERLYEVQS